MLHKDPSKPDPIFIAEKAGLQYEHFLPFLLFFTTIQKGQAQALFGKGLEPVSLPHLFEYLPHNTIVNLMLSGTGMRLNHQQKGVEAGQGSIQNTVFAHQNTAFGHI